MNYKKDLLSNRKSILEKIKNENNLEQKHITINPLFSMDGNLPVKNLEEDILYHIKKNDIIIVEGSTGSGKTTQIPKILLSEYKNIVCSEPRRIATVSVCKRVREEIKNRAKELKVDKKNIHMLSDDIISYKIRFCDKTTSSTRLKYVTDGILLQECINGAINTYDVIIIDEIHERNVNTDLFLSFYKNKMRKNIKLILMSATAHFDKIIKYFNNFKIKTLRIETKDFYKKEIFYLKNKCTNFLVQSIRQVKKLIRETITGDILVFLTGREDIEFAYKELENYKKSENNELKYNFLLFKLHSSLAPHEQNKVFKTYKYRKVILSTNISETSITIDNLSYVIDGGYVKQTNYDGMERLEIVKISKSQAEQRAGRVGRTKDGVVYRIYSKLEYEEMEKETAPEVLRMELSKFLLMVLILNEKDAKNKESITKLLTEYKFIEEFNLKNITLALENLLRLEAIDNLCITPTGKLMATLPLSVELSRTLIASKYYNCTDEVIKIISMLNLHVYNDKNNITDKRGDHFKYLKIFNLLQRNNFKRLKNYKFNWNAVLEAKNIYDQLTEVCEKNIKIIEKSSDRDLSLYKKIVLSFCKGFIMNLSRREGECYYNKKRIECYIHPSSCLYGSENKIILYNSLVSTSKEFMRDCMVVEEEDILKL